MDTAPIKTTNKIRLRGGLADDAETLGQICYEAFRSISEAHSFPPDFPSPEAAVGLISARSSRERVERLTSARSARSSSDQP